MALKLIQVLKLPEEGMDLGAFMDAVEIDLIYQALKRAKGNRAAAGRLLGIGRTTLSMRLRNRGLTARRPWPAKKDPVFLQELEYVSVESLNVNKEVPTEVPVEEVSQINA